MDKYFFSNTGVSGIYRITKYNKEGLVFLIGTTDNKVYAEEITLKLNKNKLKEKDIIFYDSEEIRKNAYNKHRETMEEAFIIYEKAMLKSRQAMDKAEKQAMNEWDNVHQKSFRKYVESLLIKK